jgi:ribosomal protein L44E
MVNYPKKKNTFCKGCKSHQSHAITWQKKAGKASTMAQGKYKQYIKHQFQSSIQDRIVQIHCNNRRTEIRASTIATINRRHQFQKHEQMTLHQFINNATQIDNLSNIHILDL